jgi:hypothetical protein
MAIESLTGWVRRTPEEEEFPMQKCIEGSTTSRPLALRPRSPYESTDANMNALKEQNRLLGDQT